MGKAQLSLLSVEHFDVLFWALGIALASCHHLTQPMPAWHRSTAVQAACPYMVMLLVSLWRVGSTVSTDEGLCPSTVDCYGSTLRGFKRPETFTFGDPDLNSTRSIHTQSTVMMTQLRNKTDLSMEEGFIQKQRQRSSRLFGGQNLFNSLH